MLLRLALWQFLPFGKEATGPGKQMKHYIATLIETITSDIPMISFSQYISEIQDHRHGPFSQNWKNWAFCGLP